MCEVVRTHPLVYTPKTSCQQRQTSKLSRKRFMRIDTVLLGHAPAILFRRGCTTATEVWFDLKGC